MFLITQPLGPLPRISGNLNESWRIKRRSPQNHSSTWKLVISNRMSIHFSMWFSRFQAPSSSNLIIYSLIFRLVHRCWNGESKEKQPQNNFGVLNDSNQIVLLLATPSPFFRLSCAMRSRYLCSHFSIKWLTSIFHLITLWSGMYALLFHSGILMRGAVPCMKNGNS